MYWTVVRRRGACTGFNQWLQHPALALEQLHSDRMTTDRAHYPRELELLGDDLLVAWSAQLDGQGHRLALGQISRNEAAERPAVRHVGPFVPDLRRRIVHELLSVDRALVVVRAHRVAHAPVGTRERHVDLE